MTAFIKHNGEYQINGYSFTSLGLKFPDGSIQSTASGNDPVSWSNITDKPIFSTVATSGSYTDLSNKPSTLSSFTNDIGFITSTSLTWSGVTGKPTTVSYFSNDAGYITSSALTWNNITDKPTIPTTTSQLTNDSNYITLSSVTWDNVSNKPTNSQILNSEILSPFMLMGA